MVLTASRAGIARAQKLRFLALAVLGLVVGHNAVYLATYGGAYHEAMAQSGHGYWLTFALMASVVAGVPLVAALLTLGRLWLAIAARRTAKERTTPGIRPAGRGRSPSAPGTAPRAMIETALRLFLVIVIGYAVQENVEQALTAGSAPGLYVLEPPLVLPVLLGISILLAIAGTWLRWREADLRTRLAATLAADAWGEIRDDGIVARWVTIATVVANEWLARRPAGRAPPAGAPA